MIIDCFLFFNELDLLEIRLNSLAPYVDKFVLVESPLTHTCKEKPLYFEENKDRFKDFNIVHLVKEYGRLCQPFKMEGIQRNYLMKEIEKCNPNDIILSSDLDEIPDLSNYHGEEGIFLQKMYCYSLNIFTGIEDWPGTVAFKKGRMRHSPLVYRRRNTRKRQSVIGRGWHFSSIGSPMEIAYKLDSFGHTEFATPEILSKLRENRNNLTDPYNKGEQYKIEMPDGPEWLINNKERYRHLFHA